jgi:hypothetical protein
MSTTTASSEVETLGLDAMAILFSRRHPSERGQKRSLYGACIRATEGDHAKALEVMAWAMHRPMVREYLRVRRLHVPRCRQCELRDKVMRGRS